MIIGFAAPVHFLLVDAHFINLLPVRQPAVPRVPSLNYRHDAAC